MLVSLAWDELNSPFYSVGQGTQPRLLGLKQSGVLECVNSSLEDTESDVCLSVEFFQSGFTEGNGGTRNKYKSSRSTKAANN